MLGRLAGWCYDHRRRVLLAWIALLIGTMAIAQLVGTHFENKFTAGDPQSQQALNLLQERFPAAAGDTADVVFDSAQPVRSESDQAAIESLAARLRRVPHVVSVDAPDGTAGARLISSDGHIAYAVVQFDTTSVNLPPSTVHTVSPWPRRCAAPASTSSSAVPRSRAWSPPRRARTRASAWRRRS